MQIVLLVVAIIGIGSVEGCGRPSLQGTRIIGGEFAREGAWPWQVSIYYNKRFICGGSLLSNNWVVTAAHCVDGFDASKYVLVLGDHDRATGSGNEQVSLASRAFTHPSWDKRVLNNDLALIQLNKPVKFTKFVQPVCLPEKAVPVGSVCYITGWGQYEIGPGGPPSLVLKQARLGVVSNQKCYNKNTVNMGIPVTDKMVCGEPLNDPLDSGCHGDSGGPFVCRNEKGVWELQGAVSWGSGVCYTKQGYSVFARITKFLPWIKRYIS